MSLSAVSHTATCPSSSVFALSSLLVLAPPSLLEPTARTAGWLRHLFEATLDARMTDRERVCRTCKQPRPPNEFFHRSRPSQVVRSCLRLSPSPSDNHGHTGVAAISAGSNPCSAPTVGIAAGSAATVCRLGPHRPLPVAHHRNQHFQQQHRHLSSRTRLPRRQSSSLGPTLPPLWGSSDSNYRTTCTTPYKA